MTIVRRALPLMVAAVGGVLPLAAGSAAASTGPAKAPGRVVFPVDGGVVSDNVDGGAARAGVALPGGGAVVAGNGGFTAGNFHAYAAEINADGSLNTTFGSGGVVALPGLFVDQVLREADGSLVVAGSGAAPNNMDSPPIVVVRLSSDGRLDASFGTGGVATLPVQSSCGDCAAVAALPGGGLVVTGDTGHHAIPSVQNPPSPQPTQWVVARLTPTGGLDPSFGQGGIATLLGTGGDGTAVGGLANGDVVTLGRVSAGDQTASLLTRLLPSGAADPTFNAGNMLAVPGRADSEMIANADGTVLVDAGSVVARYTATGLLDPSFGAAGLAAVLGFAGPQLPFPVPPGLPAPGNLPTKLLPAPGDGAVVFHVGNSGEVAAERLTGTGSGDPTFGGGTVKRLTLAFGGGGSSFVFSIRPRPLPPLAQNSADLRGTLVERADGSFLALSGVSVTTPTGEGTGRSIFQFAVAGLTSTFSPDPSFGGPATPLSARLNVIPQRAATAHARHGIRVQLTLYQPGLAQIVIKARGRIVAQSVLPVFAPGVTLVPVELTSYGNQLLRSHRGVKISATVTARDLLTNTATATAPGALR